MSTNTTAAVGLRAHSGWACAVAVGGTARAPVVLDRRRIALCDTKHPRQPYHAAEGLELKRAARIIKGSTDTARRLALRGLRALMDELGEKGHKVAGCGLLLASGRPLPSLAETLASHALIHTAEGELFRDALRHASDHCGLRVTGVRERELSTRAVVELRVPAGRLPRRLNELGHALGPPWTQDEKLVALVAWLVLAARPRR